METYKDRAKYGKDVVCAHYSLDVVGNFIDDKLMRLFVKNPDDLLRIEQPPYRPFLYQMNPCGMKSTTGPAIPGSE